MLKTYINTVPYTKFILITDSLENRDIKIFNYLVKQQLNHKNHTLQYCTFEGVYQKTQEKYQAVPNIVLHDFVSNEQDRRKNQDDLEQIAHRSSGNDIVIVDSLANVILQLGLAKTYRLFNTLKTNTAIKQIITILHEDLLPGDYNSIIMYFSHLSTLRIDVLKKIAQSPRLKYEYKKSGGRIIAEIEEYRFEGEHLVTNKVVKLDPHKLLEKAKSEPINPEELSTFRIALTDEEKLARDRLVLPYLPSANEPNNQEGKIFYELDEVDDWDEEDPDDDLDI